MKNAHQPYFFDNQLYHCKKSEKKGQVVWLPYMGSKIIQKLNKFDSVCSLVPNAKGLSFIGGKFKGTFLEYRLYYLDYFVDKIVDFGRAEYGFCRPNFTLQMEFESQVTRVVPVEIDKPWILATKPSLTIVYDLDTNKAVGELKVNGESIYKCCLSDIGCHYAHKNGEDFEDREILFSKNWSIE
jgi:hypothetical protein